MSDRSKRSRSEAESAYRRTQKLAREQNKSAALQEYEAGVKAMREKSARLKELRLARETAVEETSVATPARAPKKKRQSRR